MKKPRKKLNPAGVLHPMLCKYLDGLDALTDGRGFDSEHETARLFVTRACDELTAREAAPSLTLFHVTPDWRHGADEWQTFVRADTPQLALTLAAENMGIEPAGITWTPAERQETGNEAWRVNVIAPTGGAGVVDWDGIPATFWTLNVTAAG